MILTAKNITKFYSQRKVLDNVSINLNIGEIVGLLGPNGAGKTTFFYIIVGLIRASKGNVLINDNDITSLPMHKRSKLGISYLPQETSIFRGLSVEDNIKAILEMTDNSYKLQKKYLDSILDELNLNKVRKVKGNLLSGGEKRRTEIARCLAVNPSFILLDEPFAGVDPISVEDIQKIIKYLKSKGIGILITDHNVRETLSITDRSYLLYEGRVFKSGKSIELANDRDAKKIYLGENFKLK
ncbi:MAG: LPS export ABC transporter ATP-binding protein [Flavobacteriales bacterium]|nr:LPS export ABC transporter ATP-binding protein [Flavobacteriales bacterium]|tara:strand:+ start:669 stop:1391 length:723 start_codon:yes stop_codon:yes gene_type:complete